MYMTISTLLAQYIAVGLVTHTNTNIQRERARTKRREAVETHAQLTHKQTRTCGIDGNIRMLFYSSIFRTSTQRTCEWVCTWHVLHAVHLRVCVCYVKSSRLSAVFMCGRMLFSFFSPVTRPICAVSYWCLCFAYSLTRTHASHTILCSVRNEIRIFFSHTCIVISLICCSFM